LTTSAVKPLTDKYDVIIVGGGHLREHIDETLADEIRADSVCDR